MENILDILSGDDESTNDVEEICVTVFESMEMEQDISRGCRSGVNDGDCDTDTKGHSGEG